MSVLAVVCTVFLALLMVVLSTAQRLHLLMPFVAEFFGFKMVSTDLATTDPTEISLNVWGQDETIALGKQQGIATR